jgi:hypothetical protein
MALYKNSSFLTPTTDPAFDALHTPGVPAPYPGIYRCTACGDEIAIAGGHILPPQNHRQHNQLASIRWQLIVNAVSKR